MNNAGIARDILIYSYTSIDYFDSATPKLIDIPYFTGRLLYYVIVKYIVMFSQQYDCKSFSRKNRFENKRCSLSDFKTHIFLVILCSNI